MRMKKPKKKNFQSIADNNAQFTILGETSADRETNSTNLQSPKQSHQTKTTFHTIVAKIADFSFHTFFFTRFFIIYRTYRKMWCMKKRFKVNKYK